MRFQLLKDSGLTAVILHRIRTFCPTVDALVKAQPNQTDGDDQTDQLPDNLREAERAVVRWTLAQRPMLVLKGERARWKIIDGFAPSLTVGPSVATFFDSSSQDKPFAVRLLRQGIGIFAQASLAGDEDDLVERRPEPYGFEDAQMVQALEMFQSELGLEGGNTQMLEDLRHDIKVYGQQAYEVAEFVFENKMALHRLSDVHDGDDIKPALVKTILYCLARSYAIDHDGTSLHLSEIVDELNPAAFRNHMVDVSRFYSGEEGPAVRRRLVNQSQSKRAFVALGARGAVLCHTAGRYDHPYLCAAVLNLIDILRGRRHNLILARTVADAAIRELSQALPGLQAPVTPRPEELLKKMAEANYLYGLVVSDPSVYLLDGSTLTRLVEHADTVFQLRSLREDTERKMNALQRLWQSYQDKARSDIIKNIWDVRQADGPGKG